MQKSFSFKSRCLIFIYVMILFAALFPVIYVYHAFEHGLGHPLTVPASYLNKIKYCYFSPGGLMRFFAMSLFGIVCSFWTIIIGTTPKVKDSTIGCLCMVFLFFIGFFPALYAISAIFYVYLGTKDGEFEYYNAFFMFLMFTSATVDLRLRFINYLKKKTESWKTPA